MKNVIHVNFKKENEDTEFPYHCETEILQIDFKNKKLTGKALVDNYNETVMAEGTEEFIELIKEVA